MVIVFILFFFMARYFPFNNGLLIDPDRRELPYFYWFVLGASYEELLFFEPFELGYWSSVRLQNIDRFLRLQVPDGHYSGLICSYNFFPGLLSPSDKSNTFFAHEWNKFLCQPFFACLAEVKDCDWTISAACNDVVLSCTFRESSDFTSRANV